MAINLFRHDPLKWVNAVEETYKEAAELKKYQQGRALIEIIKNTGRQVSLTIDDTANEACRSNNKQLAAAAEATPTRGGNIEKYKTLISGQQCDGAAEYTYVKYEEGSPIKFVILVMAHMFEKDQSSVPILSPKMSKIGLSNKAHPCTTNTIQLLFVPDNSNSMM